MDGNGEMLIRVIKKKEHILYDNEKEFRLYNQSPIKYWKDGEEGDWIRSDDGKVCQVLKDGEMSNSRYIRCLMGTYVMSQTMKGDPPKNIYSMARDEWCLDRRMEREEPNSREWIFGKYVASGMDVTDAYIKAFKTNSREYAGLWAKRLLKTKRVQNIVSNEISKAMDDLGITDDYLLIATKEVIDGGDKDSDKVRAIRMLMEIRDMFPKESKTTESLTVFQGFSRDQLDAFKDAKRIGKIEAEID